MDPDYLLDQHEQEWGDVVITSSDLPSVRPRPVNNNRKLIRDRRSQARGKNARKEKKQQSKQEKEKRAKLKKKMKAAFVNSGDNKRKEEKEKRQTVLSTKKESQRHSRQKRKYQI